MNIDNIRKEAELVRDATQVGENTAKRVGSVFCNIIDQLSDVIEDVEKLQVETLAILDVTNNYTALDFGLSSTIDKTENIKTCNAIKEGAYLLKSNELSQTTGKPESDNYMIVGVAFVLKDSMKHCLHELVFTNELLTSASGTAHTDSHVNAMYRCWHNYTATLAPKNDWTSWRDYVSTLFDQKQIEKNVIDGNTLVDGSVFGRKLADKTIGSEHLKDNSVIQQAIEDEAISTQKIQDNAVTIQKLEPDLQTVISDAATRSDIETSITTKELTIGKFPSDGLCIFMDSTSIGASYKNPLDVFELNTQSAFFGNSIELSFEPQKNPAIYLDYGDEEDRHVLMTATEISIKTTSAEDIITSITAEEINTPKLSIVDGTSDQILTASGELATRISDEDIDRLFT